MTAANKTPKPPVTDEPDDHSPRRAGAAEGSERRDGRVSRALRLRQERRAQVLEVARQRFAERGYHQTSIQDILDGADIARGTFYLYFDSKRAIFDELVDDFLKLIRGVVRRVDIGAGAEAPLLQIEQNLSRVMDVLLRNRDLARIVVRQAEGLDMECDAKMADFYDRLLQLIGHALDLGQKMGLVRPCDVRIVAQAALGGLKEVVMQWIVHRDSTEEQLAHVIREILTFSLQGLFQAA